MSKSSELIKKLIDKHGITCKQVAGWIDVPHQRLLDWKNGVRPMPIERFYQLAHQLDFMIEDQLTNEFVLALAQDKLAKIAAIKEKISAGFKSLLFFGKPHGDWVYSG